MRKRKWLQQERQVEINKTGNISWINKISLGGAQEEFESFGSAAFVS